MGNSLLNYLNKRLIEDSPFERSPFAIAGPVITISREVGCGGLALSNLISAELNRSRNNSEWKVFSKEVFYKSARELNMESTQVRKIFKETSSYSFNQMLNAFGNKNYKSNAKVVKTVRDVVYSLAVEGFCVILGRGGHIIAKDIKNALHIRLVAPLEFRVETVMKNENLTKKEAEIFINKTEKERVAFRKTVRAENIKETDFDLIINCASYQGQQAVELIAGAVKAKGIIKDFSNQVDFF